jgi:hypothetical protein
MIRVVHPGFRIRMLTFYPSRIPDPGVKKAPDPGSGSATLSPPFSEKFNYEAASFIKVTTLQGRIDDDILTSAGPYISFVFRHFEETPAATAT